MRVESFYHQDTSTWTYVVVDDNTGQCAVIDPVLDYDQDAARYSTESVAEVIDYIKGQNLSVAYLLETHIHADHISGTRQLATKTNARIVLPETAAARGIKYDTEYETVSDGDTLVVGDIEVDVIHTPGHTSGMTSYLVDDVVLLTGDGLFTESVARPDLEGADNEAAQIAAAELHETLESKILPLSNSVLVAPAHFSDAATPRADGTYAARLADLKTEIRVLSMSREEFVDFILADMPPQPANYEEIIGANLGHQENGDEEAFELELGPNNCAASGDAITSDWS